MFGLRNGIQPFIFVGKTILSIFYVHVTSWKRQFSFPSHPPQVWSHFPLSCCSSKKFQALSRHTKAAGLTSVNVTETHLQSSMEATWRLSRIPEYKEHEPFFSVHPNYICLSRKGCILYMRGDSDLWCDKM